MSIEKEYQLLETSLVFYMRAKQNMYTFADAFKQFRDLYEANKMSPTPEAELLYLKNLLDTAPGESTWQLMQSKINDQMNSRWAFDKPKNIFQGLQTLKFTDAEIFRKMAFADKQTIDEINTIWDSVKVYLTRVSQDMAAYGISFRDARKTTFKSVLASNEQYIRKLIANKEVVFGDHIIESYISNECLIQMYLHARAHKSLWGNGWVTKSREEEEALRKIAIFNVMHQDDNSLYLKADYGLRDLNLPASECLSILEQNSDLANIATLNANIALMPAKISAVKEAMNTSVILTFEQAATQVLAGSPLSIDQFKQLLSPDNKTELKLERGSPAVSSSVAATSSPSLSYLSSITRAVAATSELTYEQTTTVVPAVMPAVAETSAAKVAVTESKSSSSGVSALAHNPNIRLIMSGTELTALAQVGMIGAFCALLVVITRPRYVTVPATACYNLVSCLFSKTKVKLDPSISEDESVKLISNRSRFRNGSGSVSE